MSESLKKAAAKAKETQDKVSAALAAARTRSGEPKIVKPDAPAPAPSESVDVGARLDAFIAQETLMLSGVDIPDDTGDAMYNAVSAVLYHKERITKAELAKKYLLGG